MVQTSTVQVGGVSQQFPIAQLDPTRPLFVTSGLLQSGKGSGETTDDTIGYALVTSKPRDGTPLTVGQSVGVRTGTSTRSVAELEP